MQSIPGLIMFGEKHMFQNPVAARSLGLQIVLIKKGGLEKFADADLKALTQLVDDTQFYRIVGTIKHISYGGFGNAAFGEKLIGGHFPLCEQLTQTPADCLVKLHIPHPFSLI